jgi:TP901 family phage tail tape measure protein
MAAGAWRTITVALTANTSGYTAGLRTAAGQTAAFGKSTGKATKDAAGAWSKLGLLAKGAGIGVGLALVAAAKSAMDFEATMRNVNSISLLSEKQFQALSDQVINLSKEFPQSANTLAEGLYEIASSGFQGAEGLTVLTAAAKAASAGLTTTDNSAKAITAVLNAYALEAEDAAFVSDTLFQTVNVGVVRFEELTGVIGDVVGTAAAASVGIDEVGQAIATMTLSGISANESGTSLNRLLQAMIDPSEALSDALKDVGYESGAAALQEDDLATVIGKLTEASQGNIETLLKWFPEIRAARGALALMNNEGKIYRETVKKWDDAHKGAGATQVAFAEQMKSTRAQLTLFINNLRAAGIELGAKLLPYLTGLMETLKRLGSAALPVLRAGMESVTEIAGDLRTILEEIVGWTEEAVEGLGTMGGAMVLGALGLLLDAVTALTGFLADHPVLIRAITAALLGMLAVNAWGTIVAGARTYAMVLSILVRQEAALVLLNHVKALGNGMLLLGQNAQLAGGMIRGGLTGILASPVGVAAGYAAIGLAIIGVGRSFQDAGADTREWREQVEAEVDVSSFASVEEALDKIQKKTEDTKLTVGGFAKALAKSVVFSSYYIVKGEKTPALDMIMDAKAMKDAGDGLIVSAIAVRGQFAAYADTVNMSTEELRKHAHQMGVTDKELATQEGWAKVKADIQGARREFFLAARDATSATEAGISMAEALQIPEDQLEDFGKANAEMNAFVETTGLLGPTVKYVEGQSAESYGKMTKDAQAFIDTVVSAWDSYGDAIASFQGQQEVTSGEIEKFYSSHLKGAQSFSENIRKAVTMGYDPALIADILQKGPEQAAPFLDALVSNQDERFRNMVNASAQYLAEFGQQAAEMARLTNYAVTSSSDKMTKNLSKAMAISQFIMASGGKASSQAIADELEIGVYEVGIIAQQFGITLSDGLNPVLEGVGAKAIQPLYNANRRELKATGGYIDPAVWGDTRRDSVNAALMPGEVVIRREAVQKFGARPLLDLNAGRMPSDWVTPKKYATGGFVLPEDVPKPPDVGRFGDKVGYTGAEVMKEAYEKTVEYVKENAAAMMGANAPGVAAAPEVLRRWLMQAIKVTGVPENWLNGLISRAMQESGGNPRAINLWDSNAAKGVPSKGLMQTIEPTFNAYKLPGYGDIWNPVHNAVAAIRYIIARYGSVYNLPRGGYAEGGMVQALMKALPFASYDTGGHLPPGLSLAYNGTGAPEPVGQVNPVVNVAVYVGNEKLDSRTDYRIEQNNQRIAVGLRKGAR